MPIKAKAGIGLGGACKQQRSEWGTDEYQCKNQLSISFEAHPVKQELVSGVKGASKIQHSVSGMDEYAHQADAGVGAAFAMEYR